MSDALKTREALQAARELAKLATELCDAVDATGNDVGGIRGSLVILREIGPLVDTTTKKIDAALSALDLSAIGAEGWRDISTCPKDGSHFLARQVVISDEYDEDDRIIRKGVREELTVVAYWAFGGVVQFPWNGGMPSNVTYILWRPLPAAPEPRS